ncbi:MAG: hypothetical protein AB1486_27275, partial [Planctomycetota bacterium]
GAEYVFITSLPKRFPPRLILKLYGSRWNIEELYKLEDGSYLRELLGENVAADVEEGFQRPSEVGLSGGRSIPMLQEHVSLCQGKISQRLEHLSNPERSLRHDLFVDLSGSHAMHRRSMPVAPFHGE